MEKNNNKNEDSLGKKFNIKRFIIISSNFNEKRWLYISCFNRRGKKFNKWNENLLPYPIVKIICFDKSQRTIKNKRTL